MLFGHNSNVTQGDTTYHVQTEDRGVAHAMIDTTVYHRGRVLHRRTNSYFDLLPLDAEHEKQLKQRLDQQHLTALEEIRSGVLQLVPPLIHPEAQSAPAMAKPIPQELTLELINAKSWLSGKRAKLHVAVRHKGNAEDAAGAKVTARIDGAAEPAEFSAETQANGQALLEFDMPRFSGPAPALVIEAQHGEGQAYLRFQLRAKPRGPAAG
jgi:hypothetical protein